MNKNNTSNSSSESGSDERLRKPPFTVDKTGLANAVLSSNKSGDLVVCPSGFGRTSNLKMLSNFFSCETSDEDSALFHNANIKAFDKGKFFAEHHRNYIVIYLSFKDLSVDSFDKLYDMMLKKIQALYKVYKKIINDSEKLSVYEKAEVCIVAGMDPEYVKPENLLGNLINYLYRSLDRQVILLVDDADESCINALNYNSKFACEARGLLRSIIYGGMRNQLALKKVVLAGRVSSVMEYLYQNELKSHFDYNTKNNSYFGFSEDELIQLEGDFPCAESSRVTMSLNYGGFPHSNATLMINPSRVVAPSSKYEVFTDTVSAGVINMFNEVARVNDALNKDVFRSYTALVGGKSIKINPSSEHVDKWVRSEPLSANDVWSFLLSACFLVLDWHQERKGDLQDERWVRIPNYDIFLFFIINLNVFDIINIERCFCQTFINETSIARNNFKAYASVIEEVQLRREVATTREMHDQLDTILKLAANNPSFFVKRYKQLQKQHVNFEFSIPDGFEVSLIANDGHCFYKALSFYVDKNYVALRKSASEELISNPARYENFTHGIDSLMYARFIVGMSEADYVNNTRMIDVLNLMQSLDKAEPVIKAEIVSGSLWADHVEIMALQNALDIYIAIIGPDGKLRNEPDFEARRESGLALVYYNGHSHYSAFVPKDKAVDVRAYINSLLPEKYQLQDEVTHKYKM